LKEKEIGSEAVDMQTALVHMRKATDLHAIEEAKAKVEEARSRHGDIPECYAHIQSLVDKVCKELRKAREQLSDSRLELLHDAALLEDPYYSGRAKVIADENLDAMGSISYVLDRIPDFVWYSVFNQPTTTNQGDTMTSNAPDDEFRVLSWMALKPSDKEQGEKTMTFGEALEALKAGKKVARKGWNGKGMHLWLKPATMVKSEWCKDPELKKLVDANGGELLALGTICMYTHDSTGRNAILTGWLASQSDMLLDDWMVIE